MSDMLKAGLIRSLAAAPIARAQAPRELRSENGFGAHLDAARDSIRENRECRKIDKSANSDRVDSRDDKNPASEPQTPDKPREERDALVVDTTDAPTVAMPIVVVSIAGPPTPIADMPEQSHGDSTSGHIPAAPVSSDAGIANAPNSPTRESTTSSQPVAISLESDTMTQAPSISVEGQGQPPNTGKFDASLVQAAVQTELKPDGATRNADVAVDSDATIPAETLPARNAKPVSTAPAEMHEVKEGAHHLSTRTDSQRDEAVDDIGAESKGESMRDVRVSDALERALQGESRHPNGQAGSFRRGPNEQATIGSAGPYSRDLPIGVEASSARVSSESIARVIGVHPVSGDVAAAAIGEFLAGVSVQSDGNKFARNDADGAGAKQNPNASMSSATSTVSAAASSSPKSASNVAPPAPAGSTFSQILATRLDPASSMESTARVLAANGGNGRHQVTLRLSPAELGDLRLDVRMTAGVMSLRVDADNAVAGRLIESRLGELREALSAHGISIERAEVVVRGDASANGGFEHRSPSDDGMPRQHATRSESGDGSWNSGGSHAFSSGDRSGRSDANPWWMRGDASGIDMDAAVHDNRHDERSLNTAFLNGALDLVA